MSKAKNFFILVGKTLREFFISFGKTCKKVFSNPKTIAGFVILALFVFIAIFGKLIFPYNADTDVANKYLNPSLEHPFGTDWMGRELLAAYEKVNSVSAYAYIDLYYRLAYPEKFWKIVNFYYNSGKAWIPQRNQEKLDKLLAQEKQKKSFLENVFQI